MRTSDITPYNCLNRDNSALLNLHTPSLKDIFILMYRGRHIGD